MLRPFTEFYLLNHALFGFVVFHFNLHYGDPPSEYGVCCTRNGVRHGS